MFLNYDEFKPCTRIYEDVFLTFEQTKEAKYLLALTYINFLVKYLRSVHSFRRRVSQNLGESSSAIYFRLKKLKSKNSRLPYIYVELVLVLSKARRAKNVGTKITKIAWRVNYNLTRPCRHEYLKYLRPHEVMVFKHAIAQLAKFAETYSKLKKDYDAHPFENQKISDLNALQVHLNVS